MAVVLTAALTLGPTPFFHTTVDLADWQTQWTSRMVEGETPELIREWLDMSERHPCRLVECEIQVASRYVTAAPPPPNIYGPGVEQWRSMVAHFWPAEHVDRMLRIAECESHGVPTAVNPSSGAAGIFQVMPFWQKTWPGDYTDPWTNAAVAYQIWLSQGYGAWVCKG